MPILPICGFSEAEAYPAYSLHLRPIPDTAVPGFLGFFLVSLLHFIRLHIIIMQYGN